MDAQEVRAVLDFENGLKVGQVVQARWTNSFRYYREQARIVKINARSVRVVLESNVTDPGVYAVERRSDNVLYTAGQVLSLPRFGAPGRWSSGNGVFPVVGEGGA